jgi:hypothetical protein
LADEFAADVFDALMTRLEAYGDEFERLANTREQAVLAKTFNQLVSDLPRLLRIAARSEAHFYPVGVERPQARGRGR